VRTVLVADLHTFADRVLPHLLADPVRNSVACTVLLTRRDGELPVESTATPGMGLRMFRLDAVTAPTGVTGTARAAMPADRDLLVRWSAGFSAEALPHLPPADPAVPIDLRLGLPAQAPNGRLDLLWVWEVGGVPVSTAYLTRPASGVVRVSGVYTPPDLRGNGYASACVAAMSQRALDAGITACMLYTDLANPTSNKIYQAIGYRPIGDVQEWCFG
jgi:RimJ/RimL family protein N-acetyltransferase